jgi:hypothetical protein
MNFTGFSSLIHGIANRAPVNDPTSLGTLFQRLDPPHSDYLQTQQEPHPITSMIPVEGYTTKNHLRRSPESGIDFCLEADDCIYIVFAFWSDF